ncbi:MAG: hypothetical protein ACREV0_08220 [Burkholderiales bacterium]
MKKQSKVVSDRNYQTAGQPYESMPHSDRPVSDQPVRTDVKKEGADREHERAAVEVVQERREDANPKKRKLHPMWVIIPVVIALLVAAAIWGGAYLIEGVA